MQGSNASSCIPCPSGCSDCSAANVLQLCLEASCMCSGYGECRAIPNQSPAKYACSCTGSYHRSPRCDYEPPSHYCATTVGAPCPPGIMTLGRGYTILKDEIKAKHVKR